MPRRWKQFSGNWTATQVAQAKGAGTWPGVPGAPTIGTATGGNAQATVPFTAPTDTGYPTTLSYTVTSSPGSITATGSASPITVTGLTNDTSYTFTVTATNDTGTGPASAASNAVTPEAPRELYAWGINSEGQLGLNDQNISRSSPTQVGALTTWLTIDSFYHAIALQKNGSLWTWGNGGEGRLGNNSIASQSSPVQVGASAWSFATAGGRHSLGISSAGNLYAWGENGDGQLGTNTTIDASSPVQIGSLTTWTSVTAGYNQSFGILSTGALYSWGGNGNGCLGHDQSPASPNGVKSSPTQIGAGTTWLQVDAGGEYNVAAIQTDGTLWTWGNNSYGQIGDNTTTNRSSPVQVGALTNWAQVSEGYQTVMAVKTDGTLWGWGRNQSGQIGDNSVTQRNSPVQIGSLTTWSAVSSGNGTTIALKTDGTLWTWGNNSNGQLGQNSGSTARRSSPVQVGALTSWKAVDISRWSDGLAFAISE